MKPNESEKREEGELHNYFVVYVCVCACEATGGRGLISNMFPKETERKRPA